MMKLHVNNLFDKYLPASLRPFKDIIWFLFLFIAFDFIWKFILHFARENDPSHEDVIICGQDLTYWLYDICILTAKAVHWVIHSLLGYSDFTRDGITLFFDRENHVNIDIIWDCTGIKQLIIFSLIIICYFGPLKKKLWYIPLSVIALIAVNILRLTIVCLVVKDTFPEWFIYMNEWYNGRIWENSEESFWLFYEDWFHLFHRDILTFLYYDGAIFLLWLFWEEKINKPYQRLKK